jgi:peroxiredoxin
MAHAGASSGPPGPEDEAGPTVGSRAPDFTLRHTFTEQVGLADRLKRGPVVLAFYVFDFGFA